MVDVGGDVGDECAVGVGGAVDQHAHDAAGQRSDLFAFEAQHAHHCYSVY